mgnify:FL=1
MTIDLLIITYPGDYKWLHWSMQTIRKHLTGYRTIHIVLQGQKEGCDLPDIDASGIVFHYFDDRQWNRRGYMAQQWAKHNAIQYSDADYIFHIDSDSFVTEPCDVSEFFVDGKPAWMWSWYEELGDTVPWQRPTEKALGKKVDREFMRTPVIVIDKRTYPVVMEALKEVHADPAAYIQVAKEQGYLYSEYNVMGAVAFERQPELYTWIHRDGEPWAPGVMKIKQVWSKSPVEDHLPVIKSILGDPIPNGLEIECNEYGHWAPTKDTHFRHWIRQAGRLDHDQAFMARVLPFLKPGMTAVDVGANIGTHTHAYAKAVAGVDGGRVFAFEPNPLPFECLRRNMRGHGHVECYNVGLGPMAGEFGMEMSNNVGASYMVPGTGFKVRTLDGYELTRCDYIKVDAEGMELGILLGAARTIAQFRPVLVMEINVGALARNSVMPEDIFGWLRLRGYDINGYMADEPQYDIICTPQ